MFTHGDSKTAMHHVVFVVNPLSETAQKWSSLIRVRFRFALVPRTDVPFIVVDGIA